MNLSSRAYIILGCSLLLAACSSPLGEGNERSWRYESPSTNPTRNLIEENTLEGCSSDLMNDSRVTVRRKTVRHAAWRTVFEQGWTVAQNGGAR